MKALWDAVIELPVLKVSVILSLTVACLVGAAGIVLVSGSVSGMAVSCILGANAFLVLGGAAQISRWRRRARRQARRG